MSAGVNAGSWGELRLIAKLSGFSANSSAIAHTDSDSLGHLYGRSAHSTHV
jgi:hypothetical protein